MQLDEFQNQFKGMMLQPRQNIVLENSQIMTLFDDCKIAVSDRLGVYHDNVIGSLSNALCATFPMIENLTGREFLKAMAREFIFQNPPKGACLHHYGVEFDNFIRTYTPAASLSYLPDVANFEFALNHAYYADDDTPMPADALVKIPPERLSDTNLRLRRSASLIYSQYPLIDLRDFCLHQGQAPDLSILQDHYILVYRPKLQTDIVILDQDEYAFLSELTQRPLGKALDAVIGQYPEFDFTAFLQKHVELETFRDPSPNKPLIDN